MPKKMEVIQNKDKKFIYFLAKFTKKKTWSQKQKTNINSLQCMLKSSIFQPMKKKVILYFDIK